MKRTIGLVLDRAGPHLGHARREHADVPVAGIALSRPPDHELFVERLAGAVERAAVHGWIDHVRPTLCVLQDDQTIAERLDVDRRRLRIPRAGVADRERDGGDDPRSPCMHRCLIIRCVAMQNSPARSAVDVGSVIAGTYIIEALIGRGGMGAVFLASHNRLPGKKVAIKLLHAEITDDDVLARFKREAQIASMLGHPNIVGVENFDVMPDGTPFLVLEYLEGETLAHRLRGGPLTI